LGGGAVALVATQSINEKNPTDWSDVKLYMEFRREYASLAEGYFLTDTADAGTIYIHKDDIELKSRETLVNTDFGDATHLRELLEQSHLTEEDLAAIQAALVRPEAIEERDKLAEQIKDLERLNEQMAELKQQIDSTPQMPERIL
jgi:hypothetical protein